MEATFGEKSVELGELQQPEPVAVSNLSNREASPRGGSLPISPESQASFKCMKVTRATVATDTDDLLDSALANSFERSQADLGDEVPLKAEEHAVAERIDLSDAEVEKAVEKPSASEVPKEPSHPETSQRNPSTSSQAKRLKQNVQIRSESQRTQRTSRTASRSSERAMGSHEPVSARLSSRSRGSRDGTGPKGPEEKRALAKSSSARELSRCFAAKLETKLEAVVVWQRI